MAEDAYDGLAERYDRMEQENPVRREFFRRLFAEHHVKKVLDCACGTGRDLLMFRAMGLEVFGSDLSDAMLAQARKNLGETAIPLQKADFRELPGSYRTVFDAVVCLTNAINEPLEQSETLRALRSMRAVLKDGGILVFDQGQTDAIMRDPPRFATIVNDRDFTRFFVIDQEGDTQTVHIFDFVHTKETSDFHHTSVRMHIRLLDSWRHVLSETGFAEVTVFGDWDATPYDRGSSRRLIAVAKR